MADEEELIDDPKARGKLAAFREMLADVRLRTCAIHDRMVHQRGRAAASLEIAEEIHGAVASLQRQVADGEIDVDEAKRGREALLAARAIAKAKAASAETEMVLIQGEARGLAEEAKSVETRYQATFVAARRRSELETELESERLERGHSRLKGGRQAAASPRSGRSRGKKK